MRKLLIITFALIAGLTSAMAQREKGHFGAGVNLLYGTDIKNIGVGAKGRYCITKDFRTELTMDYLFKRDHATMLDFNIDFEYLIPIKKSNFLTYPILGLSMGNKHRCHVWEGAEFKEKSDNTFIIGFNAGWGAEYYITKRSSVFLELKYQFLSKSSSQLLVGLGFAHSF